MPHDFLQSFPREVREMIYTHVFQSPSGLITLSRSSYYRTPPRYKILTCDVELPEVIGLGLLRTCKAVKEECEGMLWKLNTLDLEMLKHQHTRAGWEFKGVNEHIRSKVRSVQMDFTFPTFTDGRQGYQASLVGLMENLDCLDREWDIRSLTVVLRDRFQETDPANLGHLGIRNLLDLKQNYERYQLANARSPLPFQTFWGDVLEVWRRSFQASLDPSAGFFSTLQRNLVIDSSEPELSKSHAPTRLFTSFAGNPNEALVELHTAFGGNLIFDGKLLYKGGKLVDKTAFVTKGTAYCYREDINAGLDGLCAEGKCRLSRDEMAQRLGFNMM